MRTASIILLALLVFYLAAVIMLHPAFAHMAQSGWAYPFTCCSNNDCDETDKVTETTKGYKVPSGEIIDYQDTRVRDSPDGEFHWCSAGGRPDGNTLCLFVPPRSF